MIRFFFILLFILLSNFIHAQTAIVNGLITGEGQGLLTGATIRVVDLQIANTSDTKGFYLINIPANKTVTIQFSYIGLNPIYKTVNLKPDERLKLNIFLTQRSDTVTNIIISGDKIRDQAGLIRINPSTFEFMPSTGNGVEKYLQFLGGKSSNELSSTYSVRGGNFDENLVYVNDFEVYRPFLVRSGQQEGLSFVNPDLVSALSFSTGGFQAKYGDKLSSVLDVDYKKPKKFGGSAGASLLGANVHIEGSTKNHRFTYLLGARYKTNAYLLGSLDTRGDYIPTFADLQAYVTYQLSENTQLEYLVNGSFNKYQIIPQDRVTTFGFVKRVLRLQIFFDGQEIDQYNSFMNGLSISFKPKKNLNLKFLTSAYYSREDETFDISGSYFIGEVQTDLSKDNFGQVLYSLGAGTTQDWGRNFLDVFVTNFSHKGSLYNKKHFIQWGTTVQHEYIYDRLKEWKVVDSAGYYLPYNDSVISTYSYIKSINELNSNRIHGYLQDNFSLRSDSIATIALTYGVRFNYWDLNKQLLISPRVQLSFQPKQWKRDYVFRFAVGAYDQPPFYREIRNLYGIVNKETRAQRSYHFVAGSDYNFILWDRPFKFVTEAYYKYLYDVNPYELDNVRIRYYAKNNAVGYATGIDFRLNGEIVKDAESWVSLSLLSTRENINDDFYYLYDTTFTSSGDIAALDSTIQYPGFIVRPTDQRVNFALFLQDYIPGNDNFKVHLALIFGTGLPTGPPDLNRYRDTLRIPPYRRVDIGFSAILINGNKAKYKDKFFGNFKTIWLSMEVFNLLGIQNTISYLWIKDLSNTTYAVPNYLTTRRVNLKLQVNF